MENMDYELPADAQILGFVELTRVQEILINKYAHVILHGTKEQARKAFEIIFGRPAADELEMDIFGALCLRVYNGELLGVENK